MEIDMLSEVRGFWPRYVLNIIEEDYRILFASLDF